MYIFLSFSCSEERGVFAGGESCLLGIKVALEVDGVVVWMKDVERLDRIG
jgi:hypothetical protein